KKKDKDKANVADSAQPSKTAETVHIATDSVSTKLMKHIQAYMSSEPSMQSKPVIIIDSGATSHMTSHQSWFSSYHTIKPPKEAKFGDDSVVYAVGIGSITLHTTVGQQQYEIILSNALHIPDF
ncbi:hypothetical protein BU17DRAFT_25565, partial [Hysterangium stoloniferum]